MLTTCPCQDVVDTRFISLNGVYDILVFSSVRFNYGQPSFLNKLVRDVMIKST